MPSSIENIHTNNTRTPESSSRVIFARKCWCATEAWGLGRWIEATWCSNPLRPKSSVRTFSLISEGVRISLQTFGFDQWAMIRLISSVYLVFSTFLFCDKQEFSWLVSLRKPLFWQSNAFYLEGDAPGDQISLPGALKEQAGCIGQMPMVVRDAVRSLVVKDLLWL